MERSNAIFISLILCFSFIACSQNKIEVDYLKISINKSIPVIRSKPNYLIYPLNFPAKPLSALIIPFNICTNIKNHKKYLSQELTKILYATFLKNKVFPKLIIKKNMPTSLEEAILSAKKARCDLVIIPTINYLLMGGSTSITSIAIKIDIYQTSTHNLIWSITHAGEIKPIQDKDYIFLKTHSQIPNFSEGIILTTLFEDIYNPIKRWNYNNYPIFKSK